MSCNMSVSKKCCVMCQRAKCAMSCAREQDVPCHVSEFNFSFSVLRSLLLLVMFNLSSSILRCIHALQTHSDLSSTSEYLVSFHLSLLPWDAGTDACATYPPARHILQHLLTPSISNNYRHVIFPVPCTQIII